MLELLYEFEEGITIMVIGMGVVFAFLVLLVFAMQMMSAVVTKLNVMFPEKVVEPVGVKKQRPARDEEAIAVAIAMAVQARG